MMQPGDLDMLRRAIAVAHRAREHGNRPFGAVLVDSDGAVLLEGENTEYTARDCTGHAEINLVREAFPRFGAERLAGCTLYASAEPCPMCAGAIFWSGIGRLVYGLGSPRLYALAGDPENQLAMRAADLLASARRAVVVEGPLIEEEALAPFEGFFPGSSPG